MNDTRNFIESELNQAHLVKEFKESNLDLFNDFISAFQSLFRTNYSSFIENDQINQYKFAKFILSDKLPIIEFIHSHSGENEQDSKAVISILKIYYLFQYSSYEFNSINQYYFASNIFEALNIVAEVLPGLSDNSIFVELRKFCENQLHLVKNKIEFENTYRKQTPLEGFIASLSPEFRNNFKDRKFMELMIYYLRENKYIDRYGKWIERKRRKTEIVGLIYALYDLQYINTCDAFAKSTFCNTFRIHLSQRYINKNHETYVSIDAKQNFKKELQELYFKEVLLKRPIPMSL